MFGTIVNSIAILMGGCLGLLLKGGIKEKYQGIIIQGIGLAVVFVGLSGAVNGLLSPHAKPVLFIISLAIGGIIGEWIGIEKMLEAIGASLEKKFSNGDNNISTAFVTSSLLYCVGTMAILGSIKSGIENDHSILYTKSALDGINSIIFGSTLGVGVLFSSATVFIYQGILTILASFFQTFLTTDMMREMSIIGGILIFALGLDLLNIKKIKVSNLLPSIIVPIIYYLIA